MTENQHSSDHGHPHDETPAGHAGHGLLHHAHGPIDPSLFTAGRGIWAIKWAFVGLLVTAVLQSLVVLFSGSIALMADVIHNAGDAATAVPLWFAFVLARRKPTRRFTYGYGRVEDLAGVIIVIIMLFSAGIAAYESIYRLVHPQEVKYVWAVAAASLIGFLGNEAVAVFRIRVGKEIGSAALIADGYHARADGWTSLAVLVGAIGVRLGYPSADPVVGLLITAMILRIVWDTGKSVFSRLLDGVDPDIINEVAHAARHVQGVDDVSEVRVRWLGHRLYAEVNIAVAGDLSVEAGHNIANEVRHQLLHHLRYLSHATIHVDPTNASGEMHHRIREHAHDDLPIHSH